MTVLISLKLVFCALSVLVAVVLSHKVVTRSSLVTARRAPRIMEANELNSDISFIEQQADNQSLETLGPFQGLINQMIWVMDDDYPYICKCTPEGQCRQVTGMSLTAALQRCNPANNAKPRNTVVITSFCLFISSVLWIIM
eukprot:GHVL01024633.1.p1 GENE.GHVL01024633.1~~GHVL01024633.1.p1  ORF type:complete len:141 (-),score=9.56 GHVL01024633.1:110-532(-)